MAPDGINPGLKTGADRLVIISENKEVIKEISKKTQLLL
jgi:hypothetical protein